MTREIAYPSHHIQVAAKQQAGGQGRLYGHPLLVQAAVVLSQAIQPINPREDHQVEAEEREEHKRDSRARRHQVGQDSIRRNRAFRDKPEPEGDETGKHSGKKVKRSPNDTGQRRLR